MQDPVVQAKKPKEWVHLTSLTVVCRAKNEIWAMAILWYRIGLLRHIQNNTSYIMWFKYELLTLSELEDRAESR